MKAAGIAPVILAESGCRPGRPDDISDFTNLQLD
jgi:hypothetical protein